MNVVMSLANGGSWAFLIAFMLRTLFVKGTRQRYVMTSLTWALLPAYWLDKVFAVVRFAQAGKPPYYGMIGLLLGLWLTYLLWKTDDDDDHWFKGRGRKVARWVANRVTTRTAVTPPA